MGNSTTSEDPELFRDTMSQILGKVAESVDKVEETLNDKAFEKAVRVDGAHFVTVVTVNDEGGEIHSNDVSDS